MSKNILSAFILILVLIGGFTFFYFNKTSAPIDENNPPVAPTGNTNTGFNFVAGPVVGSVKSATLGEYLTDTTGMTLYVFSDDKRLESNCTGTCLKSWPAFMYDKKDLTVFVDILSRKMNVFKRTDGTNQYAYGVKPLYYFDGDSVPGDTNGNGVNGKWSIVPIIK